MSPTCFEGLSSGRLLCITVRWRVFYTHQCEQSFRWNSVFGTEYCIYNHLREDGASISKHVEEIKN